jgi:peptidoglycan L-alanyl-D-glutamate endopeptidase CwlK
MNHKNLSFGLKSAERLSSVDDKLARVVIRALGFGIHDFSVREGHRTLQTQQEYFKKKVSTLDGIVKKSKHQSYPSKAVDIVPYPENINGVNIWQDKQRFSVLAGFMYSAAIIEGVNIRWGGDWDDDGNNADSNFHDMPHFELVE